jgi:2-oxo-4-hydroxy-4-carboxy--5-ureidoimidazoline (OHCU) decarboxylase
LNGADAELSTALGEVAKIARLRLAEALGEKASP